jgi:hypothetical protein
VLEFNARKNPVMTTAGLVCALLTAAVITIGLTFPAAAAAACPQCYGFASAGARIYLERTASATERAMVDRVVAAADDRVTASYPISSCTPGLDC